MTARTSARQRTSGIKPLATTAVALSTIHAGIALLPILKHIACSKPYAFLACLRSPVQHADSPARIHEKRLNRRRSRVCGEADSRVNHEPGPCQ